MSDPTNPFQNRNELKDHFAMTLDEAVDTIGSEKAYQQLARLRAELAAERVLCESYLLDKNQITQAWADELDRNKELRAELAAMREDRDSHQRDAIKARAELASANTACREAIEDRDAIAEHRNVLHAELAAEYNRREEMRLAYEDRLTLAEADRDTLRAELAAARSAVIEECAEVAESYDLGRRVYEANGATQPSRSGGKIATAIRKLGETP